MELNKAQKIQQKRQTISWFGYCYKTKSYKTIISIFLGCLIFPSYGQTAPLKSVIHDLINKCMNENSQFSNDEIVKLQYLKPLVFKLSEVDKMNGIEYRALYNISYIQRKKDDDDAKWYNGADEFQVDIEKGVLKFHKDQIALGDDNCRYSIDMKNKNTSVQDDVKAREIENVNEAARADELLKICKYEKKLMVKRTARIFCSKSFGNKCIENEPVKKGTIVKGDPHISGHSYFDKKELCFITFTKDSGDIVSGGMQTYDLEKIDSEDYTLPEAYTPLTEPTDEFIHVKTIKIIPYVPLTGEQWNEAINMRLGEQPSSEIGDLVKNTQDSSLEKLDIGTSYEPYFHKYPTFSFSNIAIISGDKKTTAAIPVIITSGVHKGEKAFIPAPEYGANFKQGKRVTPQ